MIYHPPTTAELATQHATAAKIIEDNLSEGNRGDNPPSVRLDCIHDYAMRAAIALAAGDLAAVAQMLCSIEIQSRRQRPEATQPPHIVQMEPNDADTARFMLFVLRDRAEYNARRDQWTIRLNGRGTVALIAHLLEIVANAQPNQ